MFPWPNERAIIFGLVENSKNPTGAFTKQITKSVYHDCKIYICFENSISKPDYGWNLNGLFAYISQYLVKEKHKMIRFFVQFDRSDDREKKSTSSQRIHTWLLGAKIIFKRGGIMFRENIHPWCNV